ncbi:GNAT family N-acetyltransferase [Altererythrobacter aurantiacus]|uniref:GNAT family N-acetyltransferase n=1 Tax=Parapontixanthobacter aurantiacus TaxID=1463599 RepID=A0A844ZI63_9SPHN|nr:GNAT family N-acetyltransferase [Parapontixanthobacter aurantiacus]MXO86816.1 GNAT family N-acetyltransferase [Parapontixanthobacter aurantiacus]
MDDSARPFRHETERLILRDWREEDWHEFWRVTNTPAVMRYLGDELDEAGMAAAWQRLQGYARDYGHTFWLLERKPDGGHLSGEVLGFCGLKRSNVEGETVFGMMEVGWRLREDAWGRGYAREAAIASLNLGFDRFGGEEIVALTVPDNKASWGLMERLGMKRRPDLDFVDQRYGPELNPHIVYAIERADWQEQRQ